jgi:sugar/nucleoside kinase (ribokinase family)
MASADYGAPIEQGLTITAPPTPHTMHHSAAIKLAKLARARGIPVSLDAEKDRPHLRDLVPLCDFLVTNTHFPKAFTGSATTEEGMAALLGLDGGHAKMICTTLGAKGSMVMGRVADLRAMGRGDEGALPLATSTSPYACPRTGGA